MDLIIKIPDEDYKFIKDLQSLIIGGRCGCKTIQQNVINAIRNGTPCNPSGALISREALKKVLCEEYEAREHYIGEMMLKAIDNAQAVPLPNEQIAWEQGYEAGLAQGKADRQQGEWILKETDCDDGGNNRYECTNCHYSDVHAGSAEVPYCWHCGAEMKGGAENEHIL